jgi:hypothetical protein
VNNPNTATLRKYIWRIVLELIVIIMMLISSTRPIIAAPLIQASSVEVEMFELNTNGSATVFPCLSGNTNYGCTAFVNDPTHAYPYSTSKPNVSIETDYLLDVVAQEMSPDPYGEPAALHAQAVASRSLVNYYINNPPENGIPPDVPFNNSSKYQVFLPYRYEKLTTNEQQLVSDAVASGEYLAYAVDNPDALAAKALFAADIYEHTAAANKPYLVGVPDPISTACDADNAAAHQYGMSQEGANRWARGHECSYVGATGDPPGERWSVQWEHAEYILTHYYTNIHLHNQNGDRLTPQYRWVPLQIDWHTPDNNIPIMEHGTGYSVTFQIQNTGVYTWLGTGQFALIYHGWNIAGVQQRDAQAETYALLDITEPVPPGAMVEDSIMLYPVNPPEPGTAYKLRFEMGLWQAPPDDFVGFSEAETGYTWPTYDVTVCVGGPCQEQVFPPLRSGPRWAARGSTPGADRAGTRSVGQPFPTHA